MPPGVCASESFEVFEKRQTYIAWEKYVAQESLLPLAERVERERIGIPGSMVKVLAKEIGISNRRMFEIIGVPKATAEKRTADDTNITGAPGVAAWGIARLVLIAYKMAANSDAREAFDLDAAKWLGEWIERPQPALGGLAPAQVLDTHAGLDAVVKVLGAIESGAYQ